MVEVCVIYVWPQFQSLVLQIKNKDDKNKDGKDDKLPYTHTFFSWLLPFKQTQAFALTFLLLHSAYNKIDE